MKFEVNKSYSCVSPCDQDCVFEFLVVRRSKKSVTVMNKRTREIIRKNVKEIDGEGIETIQPFGSYSMAPILIAR